VRLGAEVEGVTGDLRCAAERVARVAASLQYEYWFFGEALAFDGLVLAADAAGREELAASAAMLLRSWLTRLRATPAGRSDAFAPLRTLIHLHAHDPAAGYLEAARKVADYAISQPDHRGAILHELRGYPRPMVFVDYLYYVGPYLGLLAQELGEPAYLEAAVRQTIGHIEALRDERTGLFNHVSDPHEEPYSIAWGRGNGWAMLGLVDTLQVLPADCPGRSEILEVFSSQLAQSFALQSRCGNWHTILDDPDSPLEPSIAAFFVASGLKAQRLGLVRGVDEALHLAWCAVLRNLSSNGEYATSMTEWPNRERSAYYRRPLGVNPWGQGCFLRAVAEQLAGREQGRTSR
jgi:rhamnogalacturonyl hydrolase YesR